MNIIYATALRNFQIKLRCYPKDFFIGNVLTCFFTMIGGWLIYTCVYMGNVTESFVRHSGTNDYMSYVILGGLFNTYFVRTLLNVSRCLITELREGSLESLLISPVNIHKYLWGFMLENSVTTTFETAVSFLICIPFGFNFTINSFPLLFFTIFISLFALFGLSVILCGIMIYTRDTYICQNTLFIGLFFLCGFMFPVSYLPGFLRTISAFIPITYSIELLRASLIDGINSTDMTSSIIYISILSAVYFIFGILLLKKIMKKAPERLFI